MTPERKVVVMTGASRATPSPKSGHLMSPEQKALVKETWRKVAPMADTAARLFYDRLFEIDATTRPLFKTTNLAEQRRKLIQALTVVVQGLDHLEALVPTLVWAGAMRNTESRTAITTRLVQLCCGRSSKGSDRGGRRR